MAAPAGNQFWRMRSSFGRKPKFKSAKQLEKACEEYFDFVEENPYTVKKSTGTVKQTDVNGTEKSQKQEESIQMRPMLMGRMFRFIGISHVTWGNYKKKSKAFLTVCEGIEQVIEDQKLEGAIANVFNANIVARHLGIADRNKHEHTGKDGGAIEVDDAAAARDALRSKLVPGKTGTGKVKTT